MSDNAGGPPNSRTPGILPLTLGVVAIALSWAGFNAWYEQRQRTLPLDLDGWGHLVTRLRDNGKSFSSLFVEPSLWKGPVVPSIFGLCYYLAPSDYSVLVFNALAFGLAAGLLFLSFCRLGAGRVISLLAVLGWVFYLPNRHVFGYYYAEPVLALLSASLFALAGRMITRPSGTTALALGVIGAVLVLARAPFLLVVAGLPLVLWRPLSGRRFQLLGLFLGGFVLSFSAWPVRNFLAEGAVIPFTTEGGKILYQGTYLPGDDSGMAQLRLLPEFRRVEAGEAGMSPVEQYRYWKSLALAQVREAPLAEARLCCRKALRFWVYLPENSWVPAWKTALVAFLCLPLAAAGALLGRRDPLVRLCVLWVTGLWVFHALVHTELRYNFPVMPMLFVLSLVGAHSLFHKAANVRLASFPAGAKLGSPARQSHS